MQIPRFIMFAVVMTLVGCSRAPVITITNHSTVTLSNIVVSGTGFSDHVDSVAAGAKHRLIVHPTGESGLRIAFDAGSQHIDTNDLAYIEAGGSYHVDATISTNLSISVVSDLGHY